MKRREDELLRERIGRLYAVDSFVSLLQIQANVYSLRGSRTPVLEEMDHFRRWNS